MNYPDVEYWIKCVELQLNFFKRKVEGKKVLIWGAYSKGRRLLDALEKEPFNIEVEGYIDGHKDIVEYTGRPVYMPGEILKEKSYYIFVAIEGIRAEIKAFLKEFDYQKDEDYFYFFEHTPYIRISSLMGEYRDAYDNCLIYEGEGSISIDLMCIGGNNSIVIGKGYEGNKDLSLIVSYGGTIEIGESFVSHGLSIINASDGGYVKVGRGCNIGHNTNIKAILESKVIIGDYVTAGDRFFLTSGAHNMVCVGSDCMFSHDVSVHGTNGHSILDLERKENRSLLTEKPINIEDHVWFGKSSSVLYGTRVGEGCIVGTMSVLKGNYTSHSIIAGNIATVVRKNCTWDRRKDIEFDEL